MGLKRLILYLITWRAVLLMFVYLGTQIFTLQKNFLGGGMEQYLQNPYLWSWANFDGEHYLAIAKEGYKPLTYFFFPLYPISIRAIGNILGIAEISAGLIISHVALLIGLIGLIKLIRLDYKSKVVNWTILLLLLYPTSYYFGSIYTESIFLALTVWSFYFAKKGRWWVSGIFGAFATATRIFGLALIPALLMEYWLQKRKKVGQTGRLALLRETMWAGWIALIPTGLIFYMYYLYTTTGDALAFFNNIAIFGEQRSTNLVLFPQVFYRYLFKIIPNLNFQYFPIVFTTFLEIAIASLFLFVIGIMFYKKIWTYGIYSISVYILASLSGSFSSFPRYSLSIFPVFIMLSLWVNKQNAGWKSMLLGVFTAGLIIGTALFSRGYWIS